MKIDDLKRVCVVGAGLMGRQIALNAAHHGFAVRLWDASAEQLRAAERWTDEYIAGRIEKGRWTKDEAAAARAGLGFAASLAEAAAIGVPDTQRGEVVKAFVVLRPGASATAEELRTHCASSLARFKIPAEIEFRSDLPKSMVGKVLRRALADEDRAARTAKETSGGQR